MAGQRDTDRTFRIPGKEIEKEREGELPCRGGVEARPEKCRTERERQHIRAEEEQSQDTPHHALAGSRVVKME